MKPQAHGRATGIRPATNLAAVWVGSVSTESGQRGTRIRDSTRNTHNLIGESQPAYKAKEPDRDRTQLDGELRGLWLLEGEEGAL